MYIKQILRVAVNFGPFWRSPFKGGNNACGLRACVPALSRSREARHALRVDPWHVTIPTICCFLFSEGSWQTSQLGVESGPPVVGTSRDSLAS